MSRTDAHTPYWVKLHYEGVEDHDHRHGECDYSADLERPKRSGRRHAADKCKKYVKYTVVCLHTVRERYRRTFTEGSFPYYEAYLNISPKRHEAYVYDSENSLVTRDKPFLPLCHEHFARNVFVDDGEGFARYKTFRYDFYGSTGGSTSFQVLEGEEFARHQFVVAVRDESIACSCDEKKPRWKMCANTTRAGDKMYGYSYYCTCDYCAPPMPPSRTTIKQALKRIAKYGYDEELEDYLDFEDVYHGQDYR